MSRHLERLLKIDALLRSGIRQTHQSLAVATEVSARTIRNDLAFLRDLACPTRRAVQRGTS